MFNLSSYRRFPSLIKDKQIWCSKDCGPCFTGSGSTDLGASFAPLNGENNCYSWANKPGYAIPSVDGIN